MKRVGLTLMLLLLWATTSAFSCELIVRVPEGNTYPPFFIQDQDGKWSGLSIELAEALLTEAGCRPAYQPLPFKRALAIMKEGKIDMTLNLTITDERAEYIHFIGPQLDETVVLVVPKNSAFTITSLEDLKKLPNPVGIERGKVYGRAFEEKRKSDSAFRSILDEVTEVNLNERKLENGRISGFLGFGYNVYYRLKTDPLYRNFTVQPFVINQDWVYFGFSKQSISDDMLRRLQAAFDRADRKGVFNGIRQRYAAY